MVYSSIDISSLVSRVIEFGNGHVSFVLKSNHEGFQQCRDMREANAEAIRSRLKIEGITQEEAEKLVADLNDQCKKAEDCTERETEVQLGTILRHTFGTAFAIAIIFNPKSAQVAKAFGSAVKGFIKAA